MIAYNPPPHFKNPSSWSPACNDFVKQCLQKNPAQRATISDLLQVSVTENNRLAPLCEDCKRARGDAI